MSILDLEKLLAELSPDAPCGEDLEYDPAFGELERSTQGKPEQQFGDTIVPAEEPDWREVKKRAVELLGRTKDLRAGAHLTRALIRTDGFPGLAAGLSLLRGYLEQYWDEVHPVLDPEDDNDPTFRVNTFLQICNPLSEFQTGTTLRAILDTPLVKHRVIGIFSLHDIDVTTGARPQDKEEPPDPSAIDAAFMECELEELETTVTAVKESAEHAKAIDKELTERVGATEAPDLEELHRLLAQTDKVLAEQLARRGVGVGGAGEPGAEGAEAAPAAPGAAPQAITGEIRTREDAVRVIDKAIQYFNQHEPSSPVPLLLARAKRLVAKSFIEIVQDLAPAGLLEVQNVSGTTGGQA